MIAGVGGGRLDRERVKKEPEVEALVALVSV